MRLLVLFPIIATCVLKVLEVSPTGISHWELFKVRHDKKYKTEDEEKARKEIFMQNLEFIRQHNERFNRGEVRYTVGVNKFADLTNKEFTEMMTGVISHPVMNMTKDLFIRPIYKNLPKKKDWRRKGAVTPVVDQGLCDASWAFSAVGSLEGQNFLKTKRMVALSVQNVVDCSSEEGNLACRGGMITKAFKYIRKNKGINTEASYPYKGREGFCRFKAKKKRTMISGFTRIPSGHEEALQEAIATIGPISVAIDGSPVTFQLYTSGVYHSESCSCTELNRGMLAVGYGHNKTGGDYYILKNSWGASWGMDGYIMLARNSKNMCGVASLASYPRIK